MIVDDLIDLRESSRSGMDPQEFENELKTMKSTSMTSSNFITQVFFLSLNFLRLGPLRLIQEYGSTSREFNEIEEELKRLEETRGSWSVAPNAPMILRFIEKLKNRTRELVDLRISHDFHLTSPNSKKSTVALISFFLSWYKALPTGKIAFIITYYAYHV